MRALLAGIFLFASSLAAAQGLGSQSGGFGASNQPTFLPVDEAYQLEIEVGSAETVRLYWQIAESYYLYQHRFAFTLNTAAGITELEANLPPALERTDEYFGDVKVYYDNADVRLQLLDTVTSGRLAVSYQGCADAGLCYPPEKKYFQIDFTSGVVKAAPPPPKRSASAPPAPEVTSATLVYMLLLAFIGGSILNLMPCVFPILSLKVLAFARSTEHDRHLHSWVYAVGVISSFVAVAALLIALQAAGNAIGWGFQLQSPAFVIALAYLFVAMGLSLSGVVEFGGSIMSAGDSLADRGGLRGSFFTGVLAVVVASPCTAPFMGTALGFALTQPPVTSLSIFAALGAGMAAPLLVFGYLDPARALMPKPGPWMETLKQFLAFPLYGTAIWLLWVAGRQTGVNTMATALTGALVLALGLWLWGHGGWRRPVAALCVLAALGLGAWRPVNEHGALAGDSAEGRVAWSEQTLDQLRQDGNPVFVDVTADWCITCIANETAVLFTDEIEKAFDDHGVVYMVADWTNYDADIARFLERHGRTGIPLYLLYPADTTQIPLVLPQILTKSTVLEALGTVSSRKSAIAATFSEDSH